MKIGEIEKIGTREPDVVVPSFDPSRKDEPLPRPAPTTPAPTPVPAEREKENV